MSHHNDTVSRAVELLDGHSPAPETAIVSDQAASAAVSHAKARALAHLARDILALIETEQSILVVPGKPGYRSTCSYQQDTEFPIRATRYGASEDVVSHMKQPGRRSVDKSVHPLELLPGGFIQVDSAPALPTAWDGEISGPVFWRNFLHGSIDFQDVVVAFVILVWASVAKEDPEALLSADSVAVGVATEIARISIPNFIKEASLRELPFRGNPSILTYLQYPLGLRLCYFYAGFPRKCVEQKSEWSPCDPMVLYPPTSVRTNSHFCSFVSQSPFGHRMGGENE